MSDSHSHGDMHGKGHGKGLTVRFGHLEMDEQWRVLGVVYMDAQDQGYNFMSALLLKPDGMVIEHGRARALRDDKIFDSADEKTWFSLDYQRALKELSGIPPATLAAIGYLDEPRFKGPHAPAMKVFTIRWHEAAETWKPRMMELECFDPDGKDLNQFMERMSTRDYANFAKAKKAE